jgi:hypothetical protein
VDVDLPFRLKVNGKSLGKMDEHRLDDQHHHGVLLETNGLDLNRGPGSWVQ